MTHETHEGSDRFRDEAERQARTFDVSPDIHAADHIFRFLLDVRADEASAVEDYFRGGADAAHWLARTIAGLRPIDEPFSLLDFAAGYARVARHLPAALPGAALMASDIHPAAVAFLERIGIAAHQSCAAPGSFAVGRRFDVILALSFFTHMPKSSWSGWLRALLRHLEPDGCLIFTTHGVSGMRAMGEARGVPVDWDEDGFWFEPTSEQTDIDAAEYGSTGTSFRFVRTQVEACAASVCLFQERGAGYQDVYGVRAAGADDDRRGAGVPAARGRGPRRAVPREVTRPDDCIFYHAMDVPGLGPVDGQWDLRGSERDCLGDVTLEGRSVLEIGPASGYLSFWMERHGATVTAFDLDESEPWDIVPFAGQDALRDQLERAELIRKINNAWWYTHAATNSRAISYNGTAYDVDATLGDFDIVTLNSVLLHLRDPMQAVERAAARARRQIVITDVSERQFLAGRQDLAGELALRFIPRVADGGPKDAWWFVPPALVAEFLRMLGFASIEKREFLAKFHDGNLWELYTIVGTRADG